MLPWGNCSCLSGLYSRTALTTRPWLHSSHLWRSVCAVASCSQRGITPSFSCALALTWFSQRGPALSNSAPCSGPGHIISRVRRHTQMQGTWASMRIPPRLLHSQSCLEFAWAQRVDFFQYPPGGDTGHPSKAQPVVSPVSVMTPRAERGRGICLDEQNSHLGRWPPLPPR